MTFEGIPSYQPRTFRLSRCEASYANLWRRAKTVALCRTESYTLKGFVRPNAERRNSVAGADIQPLITCSLVFQSSRF